MFFGQGYTLTIDLGNRLHVIALLSTHARLKFMYDIAKEIRNMFK